MKMRAKALQIATGPIIWSLVGAATIHPLLAQAPFNSEMALQLESDVAGLMDIAKVPGASIAIVQRGQIVYEKGFGVREIGKPARVTPKTLMMIGSTGKSMTTMMMAVLIDQGRFRWDTPVAEIYPDFALSDAALSRKITLRDTVCNCAGIQRHDLEMQFASRPKTAEGVIRSLRSLAFTGEFGKTFGYVNQMVASGGYVAAWAARDSGHSMYENYLEHMQRNIFDPIGMNSITFSFEKVKANPDHAFPHGQNGAGDYVPVPLEMERILEPFAPAGASWSNAHDAALYLITQLNRGVAPNGKRVVSEGNLTETWKPQVEIQPGVQYGLGWMIGTYQGQQILSHSGGTAGFTSEMTFMPDAGLGIVVLTNAEYGDLFTAGVRSRIIELVFQQPASARYSTRLEEARKRFDVAKATLHLADQRTVSPYLGRYSNASLGELRLKKDGSKLILDIPGLPTELRTSGDGTYQFWDPPLVGTFIRFARDPDGTPTFILNAESLDNPEKYIFTHSK